MILELLHITELKKIYEKRNIALNSIDRTYQFSRVEDILKVVEAKNIIESDPNLENFLVYNLYPECEEIIAVNIAI